jgi:hypothetical protein
MISLQERLTTILSLASQLRELDQLQERVRKAELVRRSRGSQKKNAPLACTRLHLLNRKTGKVLGQDDE